MKGSSTVNLCPSQFLSSSSSKLFLEVFYVYFFAIKIIYSFSSFIKSLKLLLSGIHFFTNSSSKFDNKASCIKLSFKRWNLSSSKAATSCSGSCRISILLLHSKKLKSCAINFSNWPLVLSSSNASKFD